MNLSSNNSDVNVSGDGCVVLQMPDLHSGAGLWPRVSEETLQAVEHYGGLFIVIVCLIGIVTNILNMLVFYKQGFESTTNIYLFALAFADLMVSLIMAGLTMDAVYSLVQGTAKALSVKGFLHYNFVVVLLASIPISACLSTIIALDRCLAVMIPLLYRSRQLPKAWTICLLLVLFGMLFIAQGFGGNFQIICVYNPVTNTTEEMLTIGNRGLYPEWHKKYIIGTLLGQIVPSCCLLITFVATLITVVKLKRYQAWRMSSASCRVNFTMITSELALTRTLVATSVLFIVSSLSMIILRAFTLASPTIAPGKARQNLYFLMTEVMRSFTTVNSTFTFFVYLGLGTRFRATASVICNCRLAAATGNERPPMKLWSTGRMVERMPVQ